MRFTMVFLPILALVAIQGALSERLAASLEENRQPVEESAGKPDPRLIKAASSGHLPAVIDWLWIQVLQDSSSRKPQPGHPKVFYDLDVLTDLDDAFLQAYVAGANLLAVVKNDETGARDLLIKGKRFHDVELPNRPGPVQAYWADYVQLPIVLAYVQLFELNDMPAAAEAFRAAAASPQAPAYLGRLVRRLEMPGGQYEVGVKLLQFMISAAKEPNVREELERKLLSLSVGQYLDHANLELAGLARSGKDRRTAFAEFLRHSESGDHDPWGGLLSLSDAGKIVTTTPHQKVLGLE